MTAAITTPSSQLLVATCAFAGDALDVRRAAAALTYAGFAVYQWRREVARGAQEQRRQPMPSDGDFLEVIRDPVEGLCRLIDRLRQRSNYDGARDAKVCAVWARVNAIVEPYGSHCTAIGVRARGDYVPFDDFFSLARHLYRATWRRDETGAVQDLCLYPPERVEMNGWVEDRAGRRWVVSSRFDLEEAQRVARALDPAPELAR